MAAAKSRNLRADALLAERGLAASRSAAAERVRAGQVRLGRDGPAVEKPSQMLPADAELIVDPGAEFVSRGGVKLANALDALQVEVAGRDCLDVGASTGGFTDCLLKRGAGRVIALDVGYGQLDWRLRQDPRVTVIERRNARELAPGELPFEPDLVTADVSFISLAKLLGPITAAASPAFELLALVKPQFELGPERVGKGGVVRERGERLDALRAVAAAATDAGLSGPGLRLVRAARPEGQPRDLHLVRAGSRRGRAAGHRARPGAGRGVRGAMEAPE